MYSVDAQNAAITYKDEKPLTELVAAHLVASLHAHFGADTDSLQVDIEIDGVPSVMELLEVSVSYWGYGHAAFYDRRLGVVVVADYYANSRPTEWKFRQEAYSIDELLEFPTSVLMLDFLPHRRTGISDDEL